MNDDRQQTRAQIEAEDQAARDFINQLKARGLSDDEVGYQATERVYGPSHTQMDLTLLEFACKMILVSEPDDGFALGTLRWIAEHQSPKLES